MIGCFRIAPSAYLYFITAFPRCQRKMQPNVIMSQSSGKVETPELVALLVANQQHFAEIMLHAAEAFLN